MHLLFAGIARLIALIYTQKVARFGVNIAIIIAYIAVVVQLAIVFYNAIDLLLMGLSFFVPTAYFELVDNFFPSNLHACFSVVISARILKMTLIWTLRFKSIAMQAALNS